MKAALGRALLILAGCGFAVVAVGLALAFVSSRAAAERSTPRNALWRVVHDLCVPDRNLTGLPAPCMTVDLGRGVAIIKDTGHRTQLLLVPTARVSGIEAPALLAAGAPNYWQAAWDARVLFQRRLGRVVPARDLAVAVNSRFGRTQDQLHFHIDCVRSKVRDLLEAQQSKIGHRWTTLPVALMGHRYRILRLDGDHLGARNPFALLAADGDAVDHMDEETLVLIGTRFADGAPGFYLLSHRAQPDRYDLASGEELLDHQCKVLAPPG